MIMVEITNSFDVAKDYFQNKDLKRSLEVCQQILNKAPNNIDALQLAARTLALMGDYEKSVLLIEKAIKVAPAETILLATYVEILFITSKALTKKRSYDLALQFIEKAAAVAPNSADILLHRCIIHAELSDPDSIIKVAREGLSKHPDHLGLLGMLGNALRSINQTIESIQVLQRAQKLSPHNLRVHASLNTSMLHHLIHDAVDADSEKTVALLQHIIEGIISSDREIFALGPYIHNLRYYTQGRQIPWPMLQAAFRGETGLRVATFIPGIEALSPDDLGGIIKTIQNAPYSKIGAVLSIIIWRALAAQHGDSPSLLRKGNLLPVQLLINFMCETCIGTNVKRDLFYLLGLRKHHSRNWNEFIFEEYAVPVIAEALNNEFYWLAHEIEEMAIFSYGMQPHDFSQPDNVYQPLMPLYESAAARVKGMFAPTEPPQRKNPIRIGLVLLEPLGQWANIRIILGILQGLRKANYKDATITLVAFSGIKKRADKELFLTNGINVVDFSEIELPTSLNQDSGFSRICLLHQVIQKHAFDTILLDSTTQGFAQFLAGLRLSGVQIFMNLNWFNIGGPMWDGLITFGQPSKAMMELKGRLWRTGPTPILEESVVSGIEDKKGTSPEATNIRNKLLNKHSVILGTISRAEKIDNDSFLNTLAVIIRKDPGACFLWFGKHELSTVKEKMTVLGISERCYFQGWVDTRIYTQVLDVHLDAFPYPGGLTIYDSMRAGGAIVTLETIESRQRGLSGILLPYLEKEGLQGDSKVKDIYRVHDRKDSLFPVAHNVEKYITLAEHMMANPAFRKMAGNANKQFMKEFKEDDVAAANIFMQHIHEIINEKAQKVA